MSTSQDCVDADAPSYQACTNCRTQKLRCIPVKANSDICQRCSRLGRACIFGPLPKRRQRKRTDARVAELEREMHAMRALLNQNAKKQNAPPEYIARSSTGISDAQGHLVLHSGNHIESSAQSDGLAPGRIPSTPQHITPLSRLPPDQLKDVVNRDIISMATARQLFETYRRDLFPHYPMVHVPASVSADELRESRPTLFLAIIAAAAGKQHPDLSAALDQEVLQTYATKSLMQSEKSLEMVQALLISAIWYHPPSKFGQLKYYEYIHMAATMAMDIGIGTRAAPRRSSSRLNTRPTIRGTVHHLEDATNPDLSMTPRSTTSSPDTENIESRRTFVSCFSICTGVSLSVRRPNMLRATSYLKQCLDYIENSPEALPSDKTLVAWVRLMMIANEINDCLQYDDPGSIASIADLRTQFILKDMTRRLEEWLNSIPDQVMTPSLKITYWTTRLYLHEVALHVDHSPEDFKAPYQMGIVHPWEGEPIPTQVLAETIAECISCAHNLINTFLEMEISSARALPVLTYVRVSFAAFVLAKLCLSVSHPGSQIGRVLDRATLKATQILDSAILHVRAIVGPTKCRVPTIFLALLFKLRQWCMDPTLIDPPREGSLAIRANESDVAKQTVPIDGVTNTAKGISFGKGLPRSSLGTKSVEMNDVHSHSKSHLEPTEQFDPHGAYSRSNTLSLSQEDLSIEPDIAMELDSSLFQFLQDVDAFDPENTMGFGDLTPIPDSIFGPADDTNWSRGPVS